MGRPVRNSRAVPGAATATGTGLAEAAGEEAPVFPEKPGEAHEGTPLPHPASRSFLNPCPRPHAPHPLSPRPSPPTAQGGPRF